MKLRKIFAVVAVVVVCFVTLATPALAYGGFTGNTPSAPLECIYNPYQFEISSQFYIDGPSDSYTVYGREVTVVDTQYDVYRSHNEGTPVSAYPYSFTDAGFNYEIDYDAAYITKNYVSNPELTYSNIFLKYSNSTLKQDAFPLFAILIGGDLRAPLILSYDVSFYGEDGGLTSRIGKVSIYAEGLSAPEDGEVEYYYFRLSTGIEQMFKDIGASKGDVVYVNELKFAFEHQIYDKSIRIELPLRSRLDYFDYATLEDFNPSNQVSVEKIDFSNVDILGWLGRSVNSVFAFEIMPGVSLSLLFGSVVGLLILLAFLRMLRL